MSSENDRQKYPTTLHLRAWRKSRDWSLDHLADLMDTDKGSLSDLENGKKNVTEAWLDRFAKAYDVPRTAFFRRPDEPSLDDMVADLPPGLKRTIAAMVAAAAKDGRRG